MRNLAGHAQSTKIVTDELTRCEIPVIESDKPLGEPKARVYGQLGPFKFQRAWYYYIVDGPVPLGIAEKLNEDLVCRRDVRVDGHCGCPPPTDRAVKVNPKTGRQIISEDKRAEWMSVFQNNEEEIQGIFDRKGYEWGDSGDGEPYITSYHIDSELGLYKFVQAVKHLE